jgi:LDH2 family malate/lactate/ureidoglycolate dehydrogenase
MSGRSAYYVEMIANADLIAIHTAGSALTVAPPGGTRPALGTNPIAFGVRRLADRLSSIWEPRRLWVPI